MSAIGLDFGSLTCYLAATRTRGIETLDNDYSERATPCFVSFTGSRRFCGTSALNQMITNAANTVSGFKNLLGLKYSDPVAQYEMSQHETIKYVKMEDDEIGIMVKYLNKEQIFSPIQLSAMVLSQLKEFAIQRLGVSPNVVISCPVYFNSRQRRALAAAAHIAELNLMGIINDTQATSITYGLYNIFTKPDNNSNSKIIMFIDIGYTSTQVFLTKYEGGNKISILSSVGSNQFGGRTVDTILANSFAKEFQAKYHLDVKAYPKAWLKLLNEAANAKKKLNSSSTTLSFGIECFLDDYDFATKLNRDDMANMCFNVMEKEVLSLIDQAIEQSSIPRDKFNEQISSIEIVGGSTRLMMFKNLVTEKLGRDISNTLNCDEAVARGCALYCAKLTPTIQIKPFEAYDIVYYDVRAQIYVNDTLHEEIDLFKRGKPSPCTCLVSVECGSNFRVVLQQLVYPDRGYTNVSEWIIRGVSTDSNGQPQKIKLRIRHDQNSYIVITQAQMFEVVEEGLDATEKLPTTTDADVNATNITEDNTNKEKVENNKKPLTRSVNLGVMQLVSGVFSEKSLTDYNSIEKAMLAQIASEKERSDSKNALEEYIYKVRDRLDTTWREFVNESTLSNIKEQLCQQQEWLYDEGEHQSAGVYTSRLEELKKLSKPIEDRFNHFEQADLFFNEFSAVILHYKKIIGIYQDQKNPQYKHIPSEKMAEVEKYTHDAVTCLSQAQDKFRSWNKIDNFPLKIQDIYNCMNEYKKKCDIIINMPIPPPPQPENPASNNKTGTECCSGDSPDLVPPNTPTSNNGTNKSNDHATDGDTNAKM